MSPEISIIVPAFNEEKHIGRCLDSILSQTFSDFEIICIDDGSTDSTYDIIKEYSEKDSRIIPLKNTGKGVSDARNFGIENSRGKYLGFVDSDDFIQPQMYEFLYRAIIENDSEMSCCGFIRTDKYIKTYYEYKANECCCNDFLVYEDEKSIIASSVCTKLIKKDLFYNKFKFEKYRYGEDTLFCSNLWINSEKTLFVNYPLYNYYTNFSSVSYVDYSNRKWMDKINSDYLIFKNFIKHNNVYAAVFFLNLSFTFLLSYRNEIEKSESYKNDIKRINYVGSDYIKFIIKSNNFSFTKKIYFYISYHFPILYKIYRKIRLITFKE